jgi:hypothetical protein
MLWHDSVDRDRPARRERSASARSASWSSVRGLARAGDWRPALQSRNSAAGGCELARDWKDAFRPQGQAGRIATLPPARLPPGGRLRVRRVDDGTKADVPNVRVVTNSNVGVTCALGDVLRVGRPTGPHRGCGPARERKHPVARSRPTARGVGRDVRHSADLRTASAERQTPSLLNALRSAASAVLGSLG